jgi:hypothetical protein
VEKPNPLRVRVFVRALSQFFISRMYWDEERVVRFVVCTVEVVVYP